METETKIAFQKAVQLRPEIFDLISKKETKDEGLLLLSRTSNITQHFIYTNESEVMNFLQGNKIRR